MDSPFANATWRITLVSLTLAAAAAQAAPNRSWTVIELTPDSAYGGTARGVDSHGDVVGQTYTYEGGQYVSHAYLWRNGVRTDIGSAVGYEKAPREITRLFVGLAMLAALLTAGLSLTWFQRLP